MTRSANILVIDFSANDKTHTLRSFCSLQYHVSFAANRPMLAELLRLQAPDLILLALQMDSGNAFSIAKQLRKERLTANVPIIFLTSVLDEMTLRRIYENGGSDYLSLPFLKPEAESRIRMHLHSWEQLRTREREIEAFNRFCSSVSGELKAPISTINMVSTLLRSKVGERGEEDVDTCIDIIGSKTRQTCQLMDRVNAYSSVYTARMTDSMLDIGAIAQYVFGKLNVPERTIRFSCSGDFQIRGDEHLVYKLMHEVLSNAVKFTRDTREPSISVCCTAGEKDVTVTVSDNGAGFEMAYADKLFRPFQRMTDAFEGSGMGLAIVQHIMALHGGTARISSVPGKGTEISLVFPN